MWGLKYLNDNLIQVSDSNFVKLESEIKKMMCDAAQHHTSEWCGPTIGGLNN